MIKIHILLVAIIFANVNCANSSLKKGMIMNGSDILPELIWTGSSIAQCLNVYTPEVVAIVSGAGSVSVVKLQKTDLMKVNATTCLFESPCKEYFSLPGGHFVWGYGMRDFQIIDLEDGAQHTHVVSHNGNDMIYSTTVIDSNDLKIWIDITRHSWKKSDSNDFALIYDVITQKTSGPTYGFTGAIFRLNNGNALYELWKYPKPNDWKFSRVFMQDLNTNNLTAKLSQLNITVWHNSFNAKNRIMVGSNNVDDKTVFYTIRWSDDFEDINVEPITIQKEKNKYLWDHFEISPDGKWAKTVAQEKSPNNKNDTITFFAINDSFPQSLSLPVYGGLSSMNAGGCFLETADWGTVYIDISPDKPGYLIIYKMRDVMAKVVDKMSKLAK